MTASFRRGFHPAWHGFRRLAYMRVPVDNADLAWRRLAASAGERSARGGRIVGALNIAEALGVCADTSRRYLRAFHALGLVHYERGYWNPVSLEDLQAGFDGNNIDEDPRYGEWTDGSDFNDPATLDVRTGEPQAFLSALVTETKGMNCELYVPRTHVDTASANGELTRFARVGQPPEVYVSWWGEVWEARGDPSVSLRPQTTPYSIGEGGVDGVRHLAQPGGQGRWKCVDAVDLLVLVPLPNAVQGPRHASAASTARSLRSVFPDVFRIPDLVAEYGWSRATANRRVKEWMEGAEVERVAHGRYRIPPREGCDVTATVHQCSKCSGRTPGRSGEGPVASSATPGIPPRAGPDRAVAHRH